MAAPDEPIRYIDRTRAYYQALGYGAPYEWARFDDVPFQPLGKPLAEARVAILTTAAPYRPEAGDQGPGAPYNSAAKFYAVYSAPTAALPDLRIAHVAIDREHTTGGGYRQLLPARGVAGGRCGGSYRLRGWALPRRADQPLPANHDRDGLPGTAPALP